MLQNKMMRVSKNRLCPVCSKPDWCLVAEDKSAAICARIEPGSVKKCGDAGWLHILSERDTKRKQYSSRGVAISNDFGKNKDFGPLTKQFQERLTAEKLNSLSGSLGLSKESLQRLGIGWDGQAYTFPMSNDFGKIIGIRLRFPDGRKASVRGSKTGLFVPSDLPSNGLLLVCEGATDTAATLDLGFAAIGRPNCNSKIEMTAQAAKGRTEIVVIGDSDEAGKGGAKKLANTLTLCCPRVKVIYPPEEIKDLRQWLRAGLSKEILQQLIQKTEPINIRISFRN